MGLSPTQLTLRICRSRGWSAEVVERWNPHARIRHDLFGAIDVVALPWDDAAAPHFPLVGVLGIQATSHANVEARLQKIESLLEQRLHPLRAWIACGNRLVVWGFKKVKGRWMRTRCVYLTRDSSGTKRASDADRPMPVPSIRAASGTATAAE